ncbi:hypothetical protein WICMUC_005867 [Wickerhamomyces mucosus]|uniref:Sphingoid long-chain base transporter RSB1 n=1 Tax=Wickerhamomyces mucosus TaxID=1378264 RepID=A0A9P8P1Q5_9ASCO|nr:hypothetical protein WICMUC_005867 [Wickerhamomyces mucosus]
MTTTAATYLSQITSIASKISSIEQYLATAQDTAHFYSYSEEAAKLVQSLTILENEEFLATATATATSQIASASNAIVIASEAYSSIVEANNLYGMQPSYGGNLTMTVAMGLFTFLHGVFGIWFRAWGFGISYSIGCLLEFLGYIGRTLSAHDVDNVNDFLIQIVCLTIAPCFIMAGIYFLLAQVISIHGPQYSVLKPSHYSYIFITFDVISLVVQAVGGAMTAEALVLYESGKTGTHIMVAGLSFQVFSTTTFLILYFDFIRRIKLFQFSKYQELEDSNKFDPRFSQIRSSKLFKFYPYIILLGTLFVYVRCIYRVIELSEGWSGYLITHEIYFMILDALMMGLTALLFVVFHPGFIWGRLKIKSPKRTKNWFSRIGSKNKNNGEKSDDELVEEEEVETGFYEK